jgi:hypothetical protein
MNLIVLGIVTAAAGFVAIGFGIPVNAFSLGNTLIMAGTTAVVGGFLLIGLGAVVRELKRTRDAGAMSSASMSSSAPSADPFDVRAQYLGSQVSPGLATPRAEQGQRALFAADPKLAGTAAESDPAIAWLQPKDGEPTAGERAVIEEFEASLAPQPSSRPQPTPTMARMPEPRPWTPLGAAEPPGEQPVRGEPGARAERAPTGSFDTVWPDTRAARSAESVERARKPDAPKPAREPARTTKDGARDASAAPATAEEPRPVAILKSGMIDGMAYTLYADGSIEAVLPTGPIRFASVDALRSHLEKTG